MSFIKQTEINKRFSFIPFFKGDRIRCTKRSEIYVGNIEVKAGCRRNTHTYEARVVALRILVLIRRPKQRALPCLGPPLASWPQLGPLQALRSGPGKR